MRERKIKEMLGLGVVLVLVVVVHAYFVQFHDLRFDELITSNMIITMSFRSTIQYLFELDSPQIIYYLYIYAVKEIFGLGLWSLRGASIFLSVLCLIEFYRLSKEFLSHKMSLVAVGMLGFSFPFVLYGTEIRPYAMLLLLTVSINRYYVLMWRQRSPFDFYKYFLMMALIVGTHLSGFLLLLVHACDAIYNKRSRIWKDLKASHLFFAGMVTLPMLYQAIRIFNHQHAYRTTPVILDFFKEFAYLFNGKYFVALATIVIIVACYKKLEKRNVSFFFLVGVLPIGLLFLKSILSAPAFEARYVLYSLPVLILFLVYSLCLLTQDLRIRFGLVSAFAAIILGNALVHERFHQRPYRIDSRGVSQIVKEILIEKPSASVISCGACLHFYLYSTTHNHLCNKYNPKLNDELIYIEYQPNKMSCASLLDEALYQREILEVIDYQEFQIYQLSEMR
jgi:4-amino-4-deoxy-L-arabinose transferase-like glycosyltransferase